MISNIDNLLWIAPVAGVGSLPAAVEVRGSTYFLSLENSEFVLLSSVCPHAGGKVHLDNDCLRCPLHGWSFDFNGDGINVPSHSLKKIPVVEIGGGLFIEAEYLDGTNTVNGVRHPHRTTPAPSIDIRLHAHACVEIEHDGFSLLMDPWIAGPAFYGAWTQYPPPLVSADELSPSAIWISHEHSDHLHPETLKRFDKSTPCYFPDFPNQRMLKQLAELGFTDLHPLKFGETYQLNDSFEVTAYNPASLWNDSIGLFSIDGYHILNLNDAGSNPRIAKYLPPIDLLMSVFSRGASSYPIAWRQFNSEQKADHYQDGKAAALESLERSAALYGADSVLPIASFFALWHPLHADYQSMVVKNTPEDVKRHFEERNHRANVIDLLPGEAWNCGTGQMNRRYDSAERAALADQEKQTKYLQQTFRQQEFNDFFPQDTLTAAELREYLLSFNDGPEIKFSDEIVVELNVLESYRGEQLFSESFEIRSGALTMVDTSPTTRPDLKMWIPQQILGNMVHDGVSWDEAQVGCWCEFETDSEIYVPRFWKAVHGHYYKNPVAEAATVSSGSSIVDEDTPIEEVLASSPQADRILRRYGLFCFSCANAYRETLRQGALAHGLDVSELARMVTELNHRADENSKAVNLFVPAKALSS